MRQELLLSLFTYRLNLEAVILLFQDHTASNQRSEVFEHRYVEFLPWAVAGIHMESPWELGSSVFLSLRYFNLHLFDDCCNN